MNIHLLPKHCIIKTLKNNTLMQKSNKKAKKCKIYITMH